MYTAVDDFLTVSSECEQVSPNLRRFSIRGIVKYLIHYVYVSLVFTDMSVHTGKA